MLLRITKAPSVIAREHCIVRAKDQKNRGLYFEYERVDPDAEKALPKELGPAPEQFGWARRARQSAREVRKMHSPLEHEVKTQSTKKKKRGTVQESNPPTAQPPASPSESQPQDSVSPAATTSSSPSQQNIQQTNQQGGPGNPSESRPSTLSSPPPSEPAVPNTARDEGVSAEDVARNRKQRLLSRMKGSAPDPQASTEVVAATTAAAATAAAVSATSTSSVEAPTALNHDIADVDPDVVDAVNALMAAAASPRSDDPASMFTSERDTSSEYSAWMRELAAAAGGGSVDAGSLPDLAGLEEGERQLEELVASTSAEFSEVARMMTALKSRSGGLVEEETQAAAEASVGDPLEKLRLSEPELYKLLKEDDSLDMDLFRTPEDGSSAGVSSQLDLSGEDEEFLALLQGFKLDEGEDEGEEYEIGDLFDAIDDDLTLDDREKLRAQYEVSNMFNAAVEEKSGKKANKGQSDQLMRGLTTTSKTAGGDDDVSLAARPVRPTSSS